MIATQLDGGGVYGHFLHYALTIAFVGSAMLIFVYLWQKGKLDLDEEPKRQMMNDDSVLMGESNHDG